MGLHAITCSCFPDRTAFSNDKVQHLKYIIIVYKISDCCCETIRLTHPHHMVPQNSKLEIRCSIGNSSVGN